VMASSEQPNELKQTQQDYEHVAPIVPSRLLKSQYGLDDLVLANHTPRTGYSSLPVPTIISRERSG